MLPVMLIALQLESGSYSNRTTWNLVFFLLRLKWHQVQKYWEGTGKIQHFCFKFNVAFFCSVWVKVSGNFQVKEDNYKDRQATHWVAQITAHTVLTYIRVKCTHISELRNTASIEEHPACSRVFGSKEAWLFWTKYKVQYIYLANENKWLYFKWLCKLLHHNLDFAS